MPSNHFIFCHPFLLLLSTFPSIKVFSKESAVRIRWLKHWNFSFSISLSNEYSGLISFRIDWFDLLAVHRILKSLLQHHSSKASILSFILYLSPHHKLGQVPLPAPANLVKEGKPILVIYKGLAEWIHERDSVMLNNVFVPRKP